MGWTLQRIAQATGVHRVTVGAYLRAAGILVRGRGRPGEEPAKPTISTGVSTDSSAKPTISPPGVSTDPARGVHPSACDEPYRELILTALEHGRNATAIYQDLVEDRLLERRHKLVRFRDADRSLDTFDFDFNKKMNRALIYELATGRFITQREDVLFLGPPGTGKSHLAQAIGRAAIQQGYRVIYREAHTLLEELAEATLAGTRKEYLMELAMVPLLIVDDRHGATRSPPASRPRPQMWSTELAHQSPHRLARRGGHEVKLTRLGRQENVGFARPLNVGFEPSTEGVAPGRAWCGSRSALAR